mmetsp:Transcript_131666/g.366973  ORF Transcript_131666/g.366973 Transcript_131666/m.366973 type:complete len:241 (+) Transcript_131666:959-1681(+)
MPELLNGLRSAEPAALALGGDGGGAFVVLGCEELIELPLEDIIGTWEAKALRERERNVLSVQDVDKVVADVPDNSRLVQPHGQHSAFPVDAHATAGLPAGRRDKDSVLREASPEELCRGGDVENGDVPCLGHHEKHSLPLAEVKCHGEVGGHLWRGVHIPLHPEGCWLVLHPGPRDVHDVQPRLQGTRLPLCEGEETGWGLAVRNGDHAEVARMTLKQLLLLLLGAVELHAAVDGLALVL